MVSSQFSQKMFNNQHQSNSKIPYPLVVFQGKKKKKSSHSWTQRHNQQPAPFFENHTLASLRAKTDDTWGSTYHAMCGSHVSLNPQAPPLSCVPSQNKPMRNSNSNTTFSHCKLKSCITYNLKRRKQKLSKNIIK